MLVGGVGERSGAAAADEEAAASLPAEVAEVDVLLVAALRLRGARRGERGRERGKSERGSERGSEGGRVVGKGGGREGE